MENEYLRKYARFAVRVGCNVQPGQALIITAPIAAADFARLAAAEGYAAGAREVVVHYSDEQLGRLRMQYAADSALENAAPWIQNSYLDYIKAPGGACLLNISGSDPEIYKGLDAARIDRAARARAAAMAEYYEYVMNSRVQWCVVAVPTEGWAQKVFPGDENAMEKLWDAILAACHIGEGDPVEDWAQPLRDFHSRTARLNALQLDRLHITSGNGTDLTIGLPKHHVWAGGSEKTPGGVEFLANIPTEEVFTAPDRLRVEGTVYGTKPYVFHGSLIEDFCVTFHEGRVAEYRAAKGEELLKMLLEADEGAARIGEIALVPAASPINRSGILFYNTLFDENAACHIAFGEAYPTCVEGGGSMDAEQKKGAGLNVSDIHEDVMIGAEDTDIDGITADGQVVPVFRRGVWQL